MTEEESKRQLDDSLKRLRSELESVDETTRKRLEAWVERIEQRLTEEKAAEDRGLLQEWEEEVMHFEVEHPRLVAIVNDIMLALSSMGI